MATYRPETGTAAACRRLVDDLPVDVGSTAARPVDPDTGRTAAWGDPPVILRCGVPLPAAYRPDAEAYEVDGVSWLAVPGEGGYFFTTVFRTPRVEVSVPDDYAPHADVLGVLAAALSGATTASDRP